MSVDIDATPDLLLLIQQKLHIVQYRYDNQLMWLAENEMQSADSWAQVATSQFGGKGVNLQAAQAKKN